MIERTWTHAKVRKHCQVALRWFRRTVYPHPFIGALLRDLVWAVRRLGDLRRENAALRAEVERLGRRCTVCKCVTLRCIDDDTWLLDGCGAKDGEEIPADDICDLPPGQGFEPREASDG